MENKTAKNIQLIYKGKPHLNKDSLLALYFSNIQSNINYANLVWGRRYGTSLPKRKQSTKTWFKINT